MASARCMSLRMTSSLSMQAQAIVSSSCPSSHACIKIEQKMRTCRYVHIRINDCQCFLLTHVVDWSSGE